MGWKFSFFSSSSSAATRSRTAAEEDDDSASKIMVIAGDGSLQEFTARVTAEEVVTRADCSGVALCNSDRIFFNSFPPALPPWKELEVGQLYFVLETEELRRRVTGADMVALALKASAALHRATEKQGRRISWPKAVPAEETGSAGCLDGGGTVLVDWKMKKTKRGLTLKGKDGRWRGVLSTVHEEHKE